MHANHLLCFQIDNEAWDILAQQQALLTKDFSKKSQLSYGHRSWRCTKNKAKLLFQVPQFVSLYVSLYVWWFMLTEFAYAHGFLLSLVIFWVSIYTSVSLIVILCLVHVKESCLCASGLIFYPVRWIKTTIRQNICSSGSESGPIPSKKPTFMLANMVLAS